MFCNQITFVLFMFNEEARIERAVQNFLAYGRVLVVDNYSTDRTVEIARSLGAEVLLHKNNGWVEDEHTVAVVKKNVYTPWIYWGFADETLDRETLKALLTAVESDLYSIISIVRKNYYYGTFCHDASSGATDRAFRKEAIDFTGNVIHRFGKRVVPESKILTLDKKKHFVHHFISNTAKTYLRSMDAYTEIESIKEPPVTAGTILLRMAKTFINNYWLRGGRKAGLPGLYMVLQSVYYEALVDMKRYEFINEITALSIEEKNNLTRDRILKGLE